MRTRSMSHRKAVQAGVVAALVFTAGAYPAAQATGPTYFIDESTDFTGNGCQNTDLNDVTSSLRSLLSSDGWTGSRFLNASAWPEDFIEQNFGGIDNFYGDSKTLSVYAGHGNRGLLQFGFQRNGRCVVQHQNDLRLGTQGGDDAAYAMWVTSCTVHLDSLSRHFNQQIRQTFGYHNSPSVKDDQPRDFYSATNNMVNSTAWIEEMEDRPGWFTGDNSPISLTFGVDSSHCWWINDTAKLRSQVLLSDAPEPIGYYCYVMYDHGSNC